MSKHVFVRPVRQGDLEAFVQWSHDTKDNLFDPDVVLYPSTFVLAAFDEDGVIAYAPVQQPLMLEALAIRPGASATQVAVALKELTQAVVTATYTKQSGEIYFLCKDDSTIGFALRNGYEELPWRVLRIKTKDLEKKKAVPECALIQSS